MRNDVFDPHAFVEGVAAISRTDGTMPDPERGLGRQCYAFTEIEDRVFAFAEREARAILRDLVEGEDYSIERDAIGNLFVTLFGGDRSLPPHAMPSHLDSVKEGGMYDGVAGIASALAALDRIVDLARDGAKATRSFQVIVYRSEESSPMNGVGCLGSSIATGTISPEALEKIQYSPGVLLKELFPRERWEAILEEARRGPISQETVRSSLEVHIEQSQLIAEMGADVGIVVGGIGGACRKKVHRILKPVVRFEGGACLELIRIRVRGASDHTGGTPPNPWFFKTGNSKLYRKDALTASCYILNRLLRNQIAELVRSEPEADTGYTSVPSHQVAEVLTARSSARSLAQKALVLGAKASRRFGVSVSVERTPHQSERVETVEPSMARRYLNLPLVVSSLSTKALWKEELMFGSTRATITDFRLIPRLFSFKLDLREVNHEDFDRLKCLLERRLTRTLGESALVSVSEKRSQPVDPFLVSRLKALADELYFRYIEMPSAPGHDSDRHAAAGIPVAMIFVKQDDGVSHSPYERMHRTDFAIADALATAFAQDRIF